MNRKHKWYFIEDGCRHETVRIALVDQQDFNYTAEIEIDIQVLMDLLSGAAGHSLLHRDVLGAIMYNIDGEIEFRIPTVKEHNENIIFNIYCNDLYQVGTIEHIDELR